MYVPLKPCSFHTTCHEAFEPQMFSVELKAMCAYLCLSFLILYIYHYYIYHTIKLCGAFEVKCKQMANFVNTFRK